MCKMMISPAIFFICSNSHFVGLMAVKGQKVTHNYQFQSVTPFISITVDHTIKIFGTQM